MSISTVTSEALQLKLRQLLPSQQGFGTDLSASDTIIPVIDLTEAAEGSSVPEYLQTALAFGSQTAFSTLNTTTTVANTVGFWRITGSSNILSGGGADTSIDLTDGVTTKLVWRHVGLVGAGNAAYLTFDYTVYLDTGESLSVTSGNTNAVIAGSVRQVADSNGVLINPSGFTPQ